MEAVCKSVYRRSVITAYCDSGIASRASAGFSTREGKRVFSFFPIIERSDIQHYDIGSVELQLSFGTTSYEASFQTLRK